MKAIVNITKNFKIAAKPLLKKYPSLMTDLSKLETQLEETPRTGVQVGSNTYKIRIKISGKARGKSGGARVITYVETTLIGYIQSKGEKIIVNLITVYDKSETSTITDKELKELIKQVINEK